MTSDDYKKRFIAEYWQTKIRYEKLRNFNTRIEAADVTAFTETPYPMPEHTCPIDLLKAQQSAMGHYLNILEVRAAIEGINLEV